MTHKSITLLVSQITVVIDRKHPYLFVSCYHINQQRQLVLKKNLLFTSIRDRLDVRSKLVKLLSNQTSTNQ